MKTLFKNAKLILPERIEEGWLLAEDGLILDIGAGACPAADAVIDCGGVISPRVLLSCIPTELPVRTLWTARRKPLKPPA